MTLEIPALCFKRGRGKGGEETVGGYTDIPDTTRYLLEGRWGFGRNNGFCKTPREEKRERERELV